MLKSVAGFAGSKVIQKFSNQILKFELASADLNWCGSDEIDYSATILRLNNKASNLKNNMQNHFDKSKGPGVFIPPPLFYVLIFIIALFIQKRFPISDHLFHINIIKLVGVVLLIISFTFLMRSLWQFFRTKNTVILIKRASSLQTTGIYSFTRNPMYLGLSIVYLGITCFIGNWWNLILFPFLILIVQEYIIKREEKYLHLEFGENYEAYKKKVRRWL